MISLAIISNLGDYIGAFVLKFLTKEIVLMLSTLSLPDPTQSTHRVLKIFKTTLKGPSKPLCFFIQKLHISVGVRP
jgi:hypothetical protein